MVGCWSVDGGTAAAVSSLTNAVSGVICCESLLTACLWDDVFSAVPGESADRAGGGGLLCSVQCVCDRPARPPQQQRRAAAGAVVIAVTAGPVRWEAGDGVAAPPLKSRPLLALIDVL